MIHTRTKFAGLTGLMLTLAVAAQPVGAQPQALPPQDNAATALMDQSKPHNAITAQSITDASHALTLSLQKAATPEAVTADVAAVRTDRLEAMVANTFTSAAAAGTPASVCPDTYVASIRTIYPLLSEAFPAKAAKNIAALQAQLPALQSALDALPMTPLAPVVCSDHINVFTPTDYARIKVLRNAGVASGVPANLRLTRLPKLPFASLAFITSWTKYELKDFEGALLAAGKGLVIDPYDTRLAMEYVADLVELKRFPDAAGFLANQLDENYALSDPDRAELLSQLGFCMMALGYAETAENIELMALGFDGTNQTARSLLTQIRAIRAKQSPSAPKS